MAWHIFAVWYVLARCGMLAQGHSGSLVLLDGLAGVFRLPFGNFFLRVRTVFSALKTGLHGRIKVRKALRVLATAALTLALCGTAWGLLAAADAMRLAGVDAEEALTFAASASPRGWKRTKRKRVPDGQTVCSNRKC